MSLNKDGGAVFLTQPDGSTQLVLLTPDQKKQVSDAQTLKQASTAEDTYSVSIDGSLFFPHSFPLIFLPACALGISLYRDLESHARKGLTCLSQAQTTLFQMHVTGSSAENIEILLRAMVFAMKFPGRENSWWSSEMHRYQEEYRRRRHSAGLNPGALNNLLSLFAGAVECQ